MRRAKPPMTPRERTVHARNVVRKRIAMARGGYDRVFGIGATKTGTSSFGVAMERLGFRLLGWDAPLAEQYQRGELTRVLEAADEYDAFEDMPWGAGDLYVLLAERFPKARFVLTVRDSASWSKSHERHYSPGSPIPERFWIRDYADRREALVAEYEQRNAAIRELFADQPQRFLTIDVCGGEGWEKLCPFLGLRIPDAPFPVVNITPTPKAEPPASLDR
ncbi:MAG: sulfotransferase [Acidimicrobiia bacterium]